MNKNNLRFLWLVLSAVLAFFAGGRWNFPPAAWLAPVFAIRFFRGSEKPWRDFMLLWVFVAVPMIISGWGAIPIVFMPIHFLIMPLGLLSYVVDRIYARRFGPRFWVTLIFPIAAAGIDYFFNSNSLFGTSGAIANSQSGFLPIMQLSSLVGLWGIAFVIYWFASVVNYVWENGFKRPALVYAAVLILVFGFGVMRMQLAPQPAHAPQVAGFSMSNEKLKEFGSLHQAGDETNFRQKVDELHRQELAEIRDLAGRGAKIVVLQEFAGQGYPDQVEKLLADALVIAREMQIYIVLPTYILAKPNVNMVRILDPHGRVALEHIKYGGTWLDGSLKGNGVLKTIETPYGKLSAIICADDFFPNIVRQAGQQGVGLLFIPSGDGLELRDIHARIATFRAVENGMSIFRQTPVSSGVIDAYGREVSSVESFAETTLTSFTAIQMVDTPVAYVGTLYPQIGDVFGQIMLLGLALLLVGIWLTRKVSRQ